jgi:uncharacterized protein YdaL
MNKFNQAIQYQIKQNSLHNIQKHIYVFFVILFSFLFFNSLIYSNQSDTKKILILTEGNTDLKSFAYADGRNLGELMGHFNTITTIKGVNQYSKNELNNYDFIFYLGYHLKNTVPKVFLNDILATSKPVIWTYTGMVEFAKSYNLKKILGFSVEKYDSTTGFDIVKSNGKSFTKGDEHTGIIQIADKKSVQVLATAYSSKKRKETPYIIKTKNFIYVADSPFSYADETDRYLLFADMLHDILGEDHEHSHSALIRIEDISPMDNPDRLRQIADILSERGIPFLVGVIPFYVDPGQGLRISLSDKPDLVDALKYMVRNGGSIVEHGVTHQYKGITASDFEFWDDVTNKPIKDETEAGIARKIEMGIQELMKNGLYPVAWETPHYTASFKLYQTISKYFSTAIEQRLSIEDFDHGDYFPYVIKKDLFGQKIIPENLGYVPLDDDINVSRKAVQDIIKGAKANLNVRDGFASCFFHEFLNFDLLKELVDGITALGYTYIDVKDQTNWVKTNDRIILTGSQTFSLKLDAQYLSEAYFNRNGEIKQKNFSDKRINGTIIKSVTLEPGELYRAEPTEFRERQLTFLEKLSNNAEKFYKNLFPPDDNWKAGKVAILWNHFAKGAAFNDQASFASVFRSVNLKVDTIFIGQKMNLSKYNLLVVPYPFVDSLSGKDFDNITAFVKNGGNIITDTKNELAKEFGLKFTNNMIRVIRVRDKYFPEEPISWRYAELVHKIEIDDNDEVLCSDEITKMPMILGRQIGNGRLIFINSRFDPYTQSGYSLYPYLMQYVKQFTRVRPFIRKENLEVYFDPGFRRTYSIENLVKQWVNQGIRIIHAAGWHEYPKYTYDYKRLIDLAHANGILVYAWIEPPQVSQKFWAAHPEWREKNYKNEDVRPSWRYPVALTDPKCVATINSDYVKLLNGFDWDGVNLAELYFEAAKGFETPNFYTPMHPSAKAEVLKKYGIDLGKIFDPESIFYWKTNSYVEKSVTDYRVNKLNEVYDILLTSFKQIALKKNGFEIIVTAMDSFGSPELRDYIGVDMKNIIGLQKKYNFTLQVEDPESLWSTDPYRYIEIGKQYANLLGGTSKLLLDLNILSFRKEKDITPFPTLIQTGTESFHLINAAAIGAPRFTIYSESSVNPQDMMFFSFAAAANVHYKNIQNGYEFESPTSFTLKLPKEITEINLDGYPMSPFRDNEYTIPAGTHNVTLTTEAVTSFSTHELKAKILSFTGNLLSASYGMKDIKFSYESETRTLITINREPTSVKIDDKDYNFSVMKGNDCFTIFLPPGHHAVELNAGDSFTYGISLTSLWSSTGIAIFGTLAVALLVCMYVFLKFVRKKYSTA